LSEKVPGAGTTLMSVGYGAPLTWLLASVGAGLIA
jgi:hypothetical protein